MPRNHPECKWMMGGPGTGKTTRAISIVTDALKNGFQSHEILFLTFNPGTRQHLEHSIQEKLNGWSGRLVYNTRHLLDAVLEQIPPWERISPLSEYQQRLWLQHHIESGNQWGVNDSLLTPTSIAQRLFPFIRQLKQGGINFPLLKHRISSLASDTSTVLLDFIQYYLNDITNRNYGDFVDQMLQAVHYLDSPSAKQWLNTFKLVVVDDLHLAHRMQWQLLEPFVSTTPDVYLFSESTGPFSRQWSDLGFRHRLWELGVTVTIETLSNTFRIQYQGEFKSGNQSKVSVLSAANTLEEGLWIAEQIERLVSGLSNELASQGEVHFSDIAVIYPSRSSLTALHEAFHLYRIPHHLPIEMESATLLNQLKALFADSPNLDYLQASQKLSELQKSIADASVSIPESELINSIQAILAEYQGWCRIIGKQFRVNDFLYSVSTQPELFQFSPTIPKLGDRINLWSIPDSRGREAKYVFLCGVNDGALPLPYRPMGLIPEEDKPIWRQVLAELGTPCDLSELDSFDDHWNREWERFSLASSRAKDKLTITFVNEGAEGEENAPSPFLTVDIPKGHQIHELKIQGVFPSIALSQLDEKVLYIPYIPIIQGIGWLLNSLVQGGVKYDILWSAWDKVWQGAPISRIGWNKFITRLQPFQLSRNYPLSHSKVGTYLDCPRKFFYSEIFEIETPQSVPMMVGTALHELAQKIHSPRGSQIISDLGLLHDIAKQRLSEHPELFQGDLEMEGWLDYVMGRIQDYLNWLKENPSDSRCVETMFDTAWQEGIRFKGRIDRLDCLSDDKWIIIDYKKSGKEQENALINQFLKYDSNFQFPIYYFAMKEAHKLEIAGFQQLVFDFKNLREFKPITIPIRAEISDSKRRKWVTPDELEIVKKRIVEIAEELLSPKLDFTKTVKTQCRPYGGFKCPYLAFCTKSEDREDAENSSASE